MANNRYCNLPGSSKISETYDLINAGFGKVQEEMDAATTEITGHIGSTAAHAAEHITYNGAVVGASDVQHAIDTVKTTLDQAIITGDSGPEAAAARVSAVTGETYSTLKDRLDTEGLEVFSRIDDIYRSTVLRNKSVTVAHRGLNGLAPENTVPAFELACQYGFWGCETDVRLTSDGYLVLYHDADLSSLTDGSGPVESKTLAEIRALNFKAGGRYQLYPGLRIATLEEYLSVCAKYNRHCVIEVSSLTLLGVDKVLSLIYQYGMQYQTIITGAPVHLNYVRSKDKRIPLGYVTIRAVTEDDLDYCASISPCMMGVLSSSGYLNKEYVDLAHSKGVAINSYIVNSYADYLKQRDWGVDVITTDFIVGV